MTGYYVVHDGVLYHHGIKGQKWGLRRWQNEDGSLTDAGRKHYGYGVLGSYRLRNAERNSNYDQYKYDRKMAKKRYKDAKRASYERTSRFEEQLEKKYKKGDRLSDDDLLKQQEYYDKEEAQRAKAKAQYKLEKKQAKTEYYRRDKESAEKAISNTSYKNIGAMAAAGVASYALGEFLRANSSSYGAQYVGAILSGAGQGVTTASIANAAYKYQYNKKKK